MVNCTKISLCYSREGCMQAFPWVIYTHWKDLYMQNTPLVTRIMQNLIPLHDMNLRWIRLTHVLWSSKFHTVRTELSFWPLLCVCCGWVILPRCYDNVEESWLRMRKRLSLLHIVLNCVHSSESKNNKLSVVMTIPFPFLQWYIYMTSIHFHY